MTIQVGVLTAAELERMPSNEMRLELVRGSLIEMPPAGHEHGTVAGNILGRLWSFVHQHQLGTVYAAETGFVLRRDPDTVRAPDVAFVRADRAATQTRRHGFFEGAPDLAVEVVSPSDGALDAEEKARDYLDAGTRLVWVVEPGARTVTEYRWNAPVRVLAIGDTVEGHDVLPGFAVDVTAIFG